MAERVSEHEQIAKQQQLAPGELSEPTVDSKTGAITGAMAGALIGGSLGPLGVLAGAALGGVVGGIAAAGPEHAEYPEHWAKEVERLRAAAHAKDEDR